MRGGRGRSYLYSTECAGETSLANKVSVAKTNLETTGPHGHSDSHNLLYPIIQ